MRQIHFLKKLLPSSRRLKGKLNNIFSLNHFLNKRPKITSNRNAESLFLPALWVGKCNTIALKTNTMNWNGSFSQSASCLQRNLKSTLHPLGLFLKGFSTNNYFLISKSWLFNSLIARNAKFINRVSSNIPKFNSFTHHERHYLNFKQCSISANRFTGFFNVASSPFQIIKSGLVNNIRRPNNLFFYEEKLAPLPTVHIPFKGQLAFTSSFKEIIDPFIPFYSRAFMFLLQAFCFDFIKQFFGFNRLMPIVAPQFSRFVSFYAIFHKFNIPKWGIFLGIKRGHKLSAGSAVNLFPFQGKNLKIPMNNLLFLTYSRLEGSIPSTRILNMKISFLKRI